MRHVALAVLLVSSAARAEDEDPDFVAVPRHSAALAMTLHGSRIGGIPEQGFGPTVELALGRDRFQYVVQGTLASVTAGPWTAASPDARLSGSELHGALGVRWIARQFIPTSGLAIELSLHALGGLERFTWEDGTHLARPDVMLGGGFQLRTFGRHRFALRADASVVFGPGEPDAMTFACRGGCPASAPATPGIRGGLGVAW